MAATGRGFGIAGHVNVYSARVRNGNWCEDTLAYERIQQQRPVLKSFETENMRTFSKYQAPDPKERALISRQINDLRSKNKEGNSYSTLFEHGNYLDAVPVK